MIRACYFCALKILRTGSQILIYEVQKLLDIYRQMIYVKSHNDVYTNNDIFKCNFISKNDFVILCITKSKINYFYSCINNK